MTLQQLKYAVTIAECNSMNKAAGRLFISQPTLSGTIKDLEEELGITIFNRNNRGITITPMGQEFLSYARGIVEQYEVINDKYIAKSKKQKFAVSMQHYSFAVQAFVKTVQHFGMDEYEFAVKECKTHEVIDDVKSFFSEIGVLYLDEANSMHLTKIIEESSLVFEPLFECKTYAYLWKGNPLAGKEQIKMEDLQEFPCLMFDQGEKNSFYFAEEVLSKYDYKRIIRANDRATMLNLMVGLNGYTLCSGIICEELNGDDFVAVPLDTTEKMTIGYVMRKNSSLSELGKLYVDELMKFKDKVL